MPTLTQCRQALARELGPSGVFTATAGSTTTVTCTTAFQSSTLPASALAYAWIYFPSIAATNNQRRISPTGLDPSTGVLTFDPAIGGAAANGTVFEITTGLPSVRDGSANNSETWVPGMVECINSGLRHLLVPQSDYSLSLVSGQYDYSLPTWLDRSERLLQVLQLNATGQAYVDATRYGHPWEVREGADGPILHFVKPYTFSGSFSNRLVVKRPADGFVKVSSVWTDRTSSPGLSAESDECGPDLTAVVTVAKVFAYAALRRINRGAARKMYDDQYHEQVAFARRLHDYDHSNDIAPSVPSSPSPDQGVAA